MVYTSHLIVLDHHIERRVSRAMASPMRYPRPYQLPDWPSTDDVLARYRGASESQEPDRSMLQPGDIDYAIPEVSLSRYSEHQHHSPPRFRIRRRDRRSTDYGSPLRREVIYELKLGTYRLALLSEPVARKVSRPTDTIWVAVGTALAMVGVWILFLSK